MPEVPVLDMDLEHEERFRRVAGHYYGALLQEAEKIAPRVPDGAAVSETTAAADKGEDVRDPPLTPEEMRERLVRAARLSWHASLSDGDLISMGMLENDDSFQFRKLVFWTTARNLDLSRYASEIDSVLDSVVQIAGTYRALAQQRAAQRESQRMAVKGILPKLGLPAEQVEMLNGLLDVVLPSLPAAPAGATPPAAAEGARS
jgi:hypothetical protein